MGLLELLDQLFNRKEEEAAAAVPRPAPVEPVFRNEQIPDTLDLGIYWSDNKQEFQMAKIANKDRATHMYVIGASGSGKTKFLEFLIQQDIEQGNGFGVIDPHGDLTEDVKGFIGCSYEHTLDEALLDRVVVVDPTDLKYTATFNPLEQLPGISAAEQAAELVSSFKKIWSDSWGIRMEDLLRNSLIALGETGLTLAELPPFLNEGRFRKGVLEGVSHPIARDYFQRFDRLGDRARITWTEPVMNKLNALLSDDRVRQMLSFPKSSFNLRDIMDEGKILLVKLDKGKLRDSADLLGSLFMAKIKMAAFSRSDVPQNRRRPFYLYIDEFQNFATDSFAVVLSEARKYGLSLVMAHQTLEQVPSSLRAIILGNTGVQVYFRVNRQDAERLAKESFEYSGYDVKSVSSHGRQYWSLGEEWERNFEELQNLPPRCCYVKHKIEGGMLPFQTVPIEPAWEVLGMDEEEYGEHLARLALGRKYVVERDRIEKEVAERRQAGLASSESGLGDEERALLEFVAENPNTPSTGVFKAVGVGVQKGNQIGEILQEKGLIEEIEVRLSARGRPARFFVPTLKAFDLLGKEPPPGRGGAIHRHVQRMVETGAVAKGYSVQCEKELGSGGIVDVHLEKDGIEIAVEVVVTPKPDRAASHVSDYLEQGYDHVFVVFLDEDTLEKTRERIQGFLSEAEAAKVRLVPVKQLGGVL